VGGGAGPQLPVQDEFFLRLSEVLELIGVYHAEGGPVGEAKYVIGRMLGKAH